MSRTPSISSEIRFPVFAYPVQEPVRDWKLWHISGHRLRVIFYFVAGIVALFLLQSYLWSDSVVPLTLTEKIWSYGSLLWLGAFLPALVGMIGILVYDHPAHLDKVLPVKKLVSLRIVSRGTNTEALTQTIYSCMEEMDRTPAFPYVIEVVIDVNNTDLPKENKNLVYLVVPNEYKTSQGSLYKARALQYALENSDLAHDAWIVHLDEESHLTSSSIKGIAQMIREEEKSGLLRIGQGAILYHRNWEKHPVLTLADNIRTGDDLARFHFQHKFGFTFFGLHGSYIVVRNDIEKKIGFDFGPNGSITEDAYWALIAMGEGYRSRWVDGYVEEQSTQSAKDFIKQRRRWFEGLAKVAFHAPVDWKLRLLLGVNIFLWAITPIAALYTVAYFFYSFSLPFWINFLANFSFVSFILFYLIGLKINLDEYGVGGGWERMPWYIMQVILIPVFSVLESLGVLGSIVYPSGGFHIVKK